MAIDARFASPPRNCEFIALAAERQRARKIVAFTSASAHARTRSRVRAFYTGSGSPLHVNAVRRAGSSLGAPMIYRVEIISRRCKSRAFENVGSP